MSCTIDPSSPTGDYTIRVRSQNNTGMVDYSDATFAVIAPASDPITDAIDVTYPTGGETIGQGTEMTVTLLKSAMLW